MLLSIELFLASAIRIGSPLALAGLGEAYSEKSGILNIGLEGIMLFGAFFSFMAAYLTGSVTIGIAAGALSGILISVLHAFMSLQFRADQTITGLALNFLALGLTSFLFLLAFGRTTELPASPAIARIAIPLLSRAPVIGPILFHQEPFVYLTLITAAVTWILFYRSEWGVSLHAVGESPQAADKAGISVERIRYTAALINGALAGIGGASLSLNLQLFRENLTFGRGYIALVVVILGRRHPVGVLLAALLMGAAEALRLRLQTLGLGIPSQVFIMFPYLLTVIVLLFSIGRGRPPSALGLSFTRNER